MTACKGYVQQKLKLLAGHWDENTPNQFQITSNLSQLKLRMKLFYATNEARKVTLHFTVNEILKLKPKLTF